MSDVLFRFAEQEDLSAIIRMLADDPLGAEREDASEPPATAYVQAFHDIHNDPRNELVVADIDGQVVGCIQLTFIPGLSHKGALRCQIEGVRIAQDFRGKKLGQQMFQWAIARARSHNCALVQLTSTASRVEALKFYERLGFTPSHVGMKLSLNT